VYLIFAGCPDELSPDDEETVAQEHNKIPAKRAEKKNIRAFFINIDAD
jgi:hypothetical protein